MTSIIVASNSPMFGPTFGELLIALWTQFGPSLGVVSIGRAGPCSPSVGRAALFTQHLRQEFKRGRIMNTNERKVLTSGQPGELGFKPLTSGRTGNYHRH